MKMSRRTRLVLVCLFCFGFAGLGGHPAWSAASGAGTSGSATPNWDKMIPASDARTDLAALYHGLQQAHFNLYVHRSKAAYDRRYAKVRAALNKPISLFKLQLVLQKFTAYGNVAHARIAFPDAVYDAFRKNGGRSFPIYLRIVDGRSYVGENYSGNTAIKTGDEILSLNGVPMAQWLMRTAAYISADTPYIAHSLLEFSFPKYLWAEAGEIKTFTLELRTAKGPLRTVRVAATTASQQEAAARKQPKHFTLDTNQRKVKMLSGSIAYLRPGPFYNTEDPATMWDNAGFVSFIDGAFKKILAAHAKTLIIDLRENPGGDNSFSDHLVAWIADKPFRFASKFLVRSSDQAAASNQARIDADPALRKGASGMFAKAYARTPRGQIFNFEVPYSQPRKGPHFTGKVYVLIDRHTYSNAVNVAAIFQDYGWGIIAGEKTSDMATTYGAMETFQLPKTGLDVGFPKAHIIRPSGATKSDGVTPDIALRTPIVASQKDDVLDELLAVIARKQ